MERSARRRSKGAARSTPSSWPRRAMRRRAARARAPATPRKRPDVVRRGTRSRCDSRAARSLEAVSTAQAACAGLSVAMPNAAPPNRRRAASRVSRWRRRVRRGDPAATSILTRIRREKPSRPRATGAPPIVEAGRTTRRRRPPRPSRALFPSRRARSDVRPRFSVWFHGGLLRKHPIQP